tara:strand:- start:190 stop:1011 length:822 start_codon:yes stop_codon:yes gene_type:complete
MLFSSALGHAMSDTLYIMKQSTSVGFTESQFTSFLRGTSFSRTNAHLQVQSNEVLDLVLYNLDTLNHTFTIDNVVEGNNVIPALGSLSIQIPPLPDGTYRFYSDSPYGKYLGASGVLQVGYFEHARYCWNTFDLDVQDSESIVLGENDQLSPDYLPTNFLINGNVYPTSASDSLTAVSGALNDTIIISMVNSGNMIQSFHFHGYHVTILNSNQENTQVGWSKDSLPIRKGEGITLMLVAYQTGTYPVHAHNLVATTTSGIYPGGMITLITISP